MAQSVQIIAHHYTRVPVSYESTFRNLVVDTVPKDLQQITSWLHSVNYWSAASAATARLAWLCCFGIFFFFWFCCPPCQIRSHYWPGSMIFLLFLHLYAFYLDTLISSAQACQSGSRGTRLCDHCYYCCLPRRMRWVCCWSNQLLLVESTFRPMKKRSGGW